jgi:putative sterol carrier protein
VITAVVRPAQQGALTVTDPTSDFFGNLETHGAPLLANVEASIRIDLDQGKTTQHRLLTIDRGKVSVSQKNAKADAVLHTDKEMFDRLVQGEVNPIASFLRGLWRAEGNPELVVLFQGLFPASQNPRSGRKEVGRRGGRPA